MDDDQFRRLLNRFGLSWSGYRKVRKGVKKRIRRHMKALGCQDFEAYLTALDGDLALREKCEVLMTVSISRFFRDRGFWETLENQILPVIIPRDVERVKFWFAGCACGEEVFSFAILWDRLRDRFQVLPEIKMLATDINLVCLERAQKGLYSLSSLKEVPEDVRSKYFKRHGKANQYRIASSLERGISWRLHHLLHDPPDRNFHLIFLRNNLMTYYEDALKTPAFQKVVDCLVPSGVLIIGSHEKLPMEIKDLLPYRGYSYVFQSRDPSTNGESTKIEILTAETQSTLSKSRK
jgi:chemotaxis protein methyltransferase CheR